MQQASTAVIVWTNSTIRRLLEHQAACDGVDLSTYAEAILRTAITPPKRTRRARGYLKLLNAEAADHAERGVTQEDGGGG